MTPEQIRKQSAGLAEFYAAKAQGKTLQAKSSGGWRDISDEVGPSMSSSLHCYRIKPEPRKVWSVGSYITDKQEVVDQWRKNGDVITEWQEVLP